MNSDEGLFLECVEEGQGTPEGIFEAVQTRGKLTDDLSILCLRYMESGQD